MGFAEFLKTLFGGGGGADKKDSCIACDATDLAELAPGAYRCVPCGYEGGDGYAAYVEDNERARLRELDAAELKARAIKQLTDARFTLLAAISGEMRDDGPVDSSDDSPWDLVIEAGDAVFGLDLDDFSLGRGSDAHAEERARIANERRQGIAEAAQTVIALRPVLDVLSEKGLDMTEHRRRLDIIADSDPPPLDTLKNFITNAGKRIDA